MEFRMRLFSIFCCCGHTEDDSLEDNKLIEERNLDYKHDGNQRANQIKCFSANNRRHSNNSEASTAHIQLLNLRSNSDTYSTECTHEKQKSLNIKAKNTSSEYVGEPASSSVLPVVRRARKLSQTLNEVEFCEKCVRETTSLEFVYSSPKGSRTETENELSANTVHLHTRNHLDFDQRYNGDNHHNGDSSHSDHDISGDMELIKSSMKESFVSVNVDSSKLLPRKSQLRLASSLSMPNYIYLNSTYESQYFNTEENSILNIGAGNTAENNGRWSGLSWTSRQSRCQSSIAEFNEEIDGPIICKDMGDIDMEVLLSSDDSAGDFKSTVENYTSEPRLVPSRTTATGIDRSKLSVGEPIAPKLTSSDLSVKESKERASSKDIMKNNSSIESQQLQSKKSLSLSSVRSSSGPKLSSLESSSVLGADNVTVNVWHPIILEEDEDEEHH